MKNKLFILAIFALIALGAKAQDYSKYLDMALEKLEAGECDKARQYYGVYKEMTGDSKSSIEELLSDCYQTSEKAKSETKNQSKPKTNIDLSNNSYCQKGKNRYVAWGMAGAGYPWNLVTSIEFRGGELIGFGLYGDIGMDFTSWKDSHGDVNTDIYFRYAGGVKFYPYRGLFLDAGYGTIAKPHGVDHSHGVLFHVGYNLVTNLVDGPNEGVGFFLGVSGGASYDVINKEYAPSVNVKVGIAFGWDK